MKLIDKWMLISINFLVWAAFISCHTGPKQPVVTAGSDAVIKLGSTYQDSLQVNSSCVIFYEPDSQQLQKIRAVTKKNVFQSSMHEFFYQQRNAHIFLKKYWPSLKIIDARKIRYIFFLNGDQVVKMIDLDRFNDACGMIVFNGKKPPRLLDMTNIDSQMPDYFDNQ